MIAIISIALELHSRGGEDSKFTVRLGGIHCQITVRSASFIAQSIEEIELVITLISDWNLRLF